MSRNALKFRRPSNGKLAAFAVMVVIVTATWVVLARTGKASAPPPAEKVPVAGEPAGAAPIIVPDDLDLLREFIPPQEEEKLPERTPDFAGGDAPP